jgi:hypothetical protein
VDSYCEKLHTVCFLCLAALTGEGGGEGGHAAEFWDKEEKSPRPRAGNYYLFSVQNGRCVAGHLQVHNTVPKYTSAVRNWG